ncbi:MAG: hypothetical protein JWQ02_4585 [Capsulimonas sp.]|nr:hypothetical protein [Capsulimonas sp.]
MDERSFPTRLGKHQEVLVTPILHLDLVVIFTIQVASELLH